MEPRAPDFDLPEAFGGRVRLSELLRERWAILFFYPSDWGWVCTSEMKAIQEMLPRLSILGMIPIGIGTNSIISHSVWKEHLKIEYPLLSDFDGKVCMDYGVLDTEGFNQGRAKRSVIIVDKEGTIRYEWLNENPWVEPDYDEILRIAQNLAIA